MAGVSDRIDILQRVDERLQEYDFGSSRRNERSASWGRGGSGGEALRGLRAVAGSEEDSYVAEAEGDERGTEVSYSGGVTLIKEEG